MLDTKSVYPWWRTSEKDIAQCLDSLRTGQTKILCRSAGGREICYAVYGDKPDFGRRANYSSACGAHDTRFYADKSKKPPVVMLIGAVHGQELEGTAALLNLISLLETGKDLRGCENSLARKVSDSKMRLIIIPVLNADGRARCEPDSMLEMTPDELRYWGQGTWKDGSLCGWPDCKAVHPIKSSAGFLGAYYNDDGVNLMHDNFFNPMAEETSALLKLADDEAPDIIVQLHGGSNSTNELLQTSYVPQYIKEGIHALAERCAGLAEAAGLPSSVRQVSAPENFPPPSFNLASALHHVCGGISAVYESNEGLVARNAFGAEDILEQHYLLFHAIFDYCAATQWKSPSRGDPNTPPRLT